MRLNDKYKSTNVSHEGELQLKFIYKPAHRHIESFVVSIKKRPTHFIFSLLFYFQESNRIEYLTTITEMDYPV